MPLFMSDEEFQRCLGDAGKVADRADEFIQKINGEMEKVKSDSQAASVALEQTCFDIEQKYASLSTENEELHSKHLELKALLEQRDSEIERVQSEKQQLVLQSIEKDGENERLRREASEVHISKRQLMELLEHKELEISEKNATIKSYLDKIVNLTENATSKEVQMADMEFEVGQSKAASARFSQEKELLERHNAWLNEELNAKMTSLIQLRKEKGELEADMSSKLADAEKKLKESSSSVKMQNDRVKELEEKLSSVESELLLVKNASAAAEESFNVEISTVNKLVELYKESSEEWSKKAGDLEGVIKAMEVHFNQVENEYKDKLENEVDLKTKLEKESSELREQLQKITTDLENLKKGNEQQLVLSNNAAELYPRSIDAPEVVGDDHAIVPIIPVGVSETACAASLLRDSWTLVKLYSKYQEASDALSHEQMGRKHAQAVLERVLYEVEKKAVAIFAEREEHERFLEAYSTLEQKLQDSKQEHSLLEATIQDLKASLKRQERDYVIAQKEIVDLQKQVAILLKECRDVQLRCGSAASHNDDELTMVPIVSSRDENSIEQIISERLLAFKDIHGLVEKNVQLRSLVRKLSEQVEEREAILKDEYERELQRHTEDSESKVNAVLQKAEEQAVMIESLHNSVALYKKLYEEQKRNSYPPHQQDVVQEQQSRNTHLRQITHDLSAKAQNHYFGTLKDLEEDLSKLRNEATTLRAERGKLMMEVQFAQEKLSRFMKEFEQQKEEHNQVLARNIEFQHLIINYQNKLRESAQSLEASNELLSKLQMEVSILKHEKEISENSEKRASDEVRSLSERFHRLQATLETIHTTDTTREEARSSERKQRETYINKMEREWAEVKQELQVERDNYRNLSLEREAILRNALKQLEDLRKELADAVQSAAAAEARAAVAEARRSDLEKILESGINKSSDAVEGNVSYSEKVMANFHDEAEKLKVEAQASNEHMLQYKHLAQVNEEACKQMELAHESFKNEAEEVKRSLEAELGSLRNQIHQHEDEYRRKIEEVMAAIAEKEEALATAISEIAHLKNDCSVKTSQLMEMESQVSALRENLKEEHTRWQSTKENYERQVILQSETIKELTEASNALALVQDELSALRKVADALKVENNELNSKWETEKLAIEVYRQEADKKYAEVDELNKTLLTRLEALHIKLAEKDRGIASESISSDENAMLNVVNYLRKTKEIAETEISLLKQEKHRLQAQLESALKSSEGAQASLSAERAKSRASLFSDEDFKSLQMQVREISLLRESNMQLREENKHNFEECHKLREAFQNVQKETEKLEKLLREKDSELEANRLEIEDLQTEKVNLELRIDELMGKYKEINVDEYNLLKESCLKNAAILREKDSEIEGLKKQLSESQEAAALLEQNLAKNGAELNERDARIKELLQSQASLKSEIERARRLIVHRKKLEKDKEDLVKEKEELVKQMEALSKELEAAKQGSSAEQGQAQKEMEEKDTRIQSLMKALERCREDLKKERDDHQKEKDKGSKNRKAVADTLETVAQHKKTFSAELDKHKEAIRLVTDEIEKLKSSGQSLADTVVPPPSAVLEDFATSYFQAVDNFAQAAQLACSEAPVTSDSGPADTSLSAGATSGQVATPNVQVPVTRATDEKEKRIVAVKPVPKPARRLMRPSIAKPKGPHGDDVNMPEADDSSAVLPSQTTESQGHSSMPVTAIVRKRSSSSISSDVQEDMPAMEEPVSDLPIPPQKKSKASEEVAPECGEEAPLPSSGLPVPDVEITESLEDAATPQQVDNEESADPGDEVETAWEQAEEPTTDEQIQVELRESGEATEDKPENQVQFNDQTETEIQQIVTESGDQKEEGEMETDFDDNNGDANASREETSSPVIGEILTEQPLETEKPEAGEILPDAPALEKNDAKDTTTEIANKPGNPVSPTPETPEPSPALTVEEAMSSTQTDVGSSDQGERSPSQDTGVKPPSPLNSAPTTINLQERARLRASLRQAGMGTTSPARNRGRAPGRAPRGGRVPRGRSAG